MNPSDDQTSGVGLQVVPAGMPPLLYLRLTLVLVLIGTAGPYQPTQIPVIVYFPPESALTSESLFGPAVANSPRTKMTIPERPQFPAWWRL